MPGSTRRPANQPVIELPRTDSSLLRHCERGEDAAATALYRRYANRLRALSRVYCAPSFAGRFDGDDVVQSVFRMFFQGARQHEYTIPPGGELWGLLMVLALNKIRGLIKFHRAGRRDVRHTTSMPAARGDSEPTTDDSAEALLRMVIDEQVEGLPESNREMIRLRIEGHAVAEIAERTGRSHRTVERVLQDFRARLKRS